MFCTHCGAPITPETQEFCPNCGAPTKDVRPPYGYTPPPPPYGMGYPPPPPPVSYAEADGLLKVACVFFPILGIILYCIDKDKKPVAARQCLKISLIVMAVTIAVPLLIWVFILMLAVCGAIML